MKIAIGQYKKQLAIFLIILVVSISYGQTLLMYFWQDDAAVIFKLQHIAEPAGSYGLGPFGEGPYKYTITPFIPFYQFFGLNPFGYFFVGLLLYFISVVCIYFLSKDFFDNKKIAFFSTLIFAAGYIGSHSMFKISNSWQNSLGLSLAVLMLWSLVKFLKSGQFKFFVLSLLLFFISVHFVFIRSHSLIFLVLILDAIFRLVPFKISEFFKFILRQIPFWIIFYMYYLKNETVGATAFSGIKSQLIQGKIEIFSTLFATAGNVFFPTNFQNWLINLFSNNIQNLTLFFFSLSAWLIYYFFGLKQITKFIALLLFFFCFMLNKYFYNQNLYWYRNSENLLSGALGMYIIVFVLILSFSLWRNFKLLSLGLFFGLSIIVTQIFGYFIQYPEATFDTTHRYLYYAFVGYALILGSLTYLSFFILKEKKIFKNYTFVPFLPIFLIILMNTLLSFRYQHTFVTERSHPTQKFYETLKMQVPNFPKDSIFYFDIASDSKSQSQFRDFFSVGSMPETTAIAIYYGVDRYDLSMVTDYEELLSKLAKDRTKIDQLYTFYYGASLGLVDTSEKSRQLFQHGSSAQILLMKQTSQNSASLLTDSLSPLAPIHLSFKAKISPLPEIKYPYLTNSPATFSQSEKLQMIAYLLSKLKYYANVKVDTLSEWKFQEKVNLADNNLESSWRGHRIYWHDHQKEQLTIDLGEVKNVNRVLWMNWNHTLTPTVYTILASPDGQSWKVVKEVRGGEKKDGEWVEDRFDSTPARFVRMDIAGTLSNDAPAISEFEVVDSSFSDVDINAALNFLENPFANIQNELEMNNLLSQISPLLRFNVSVITDKTTVTTKVPVNELSVFSPFSVILKPVGLKISNITVDGPVGPLKLEIDLAEARNISLEEAQKSGVIKEFKEN
ncbi:MAG: discoidin domain-containing protein [Candidatus Daviesbacteria bacterium]|nr:MAG: discoidin domain-containing protein [Candidatus Daviesbacteria bacterium]